jgi:hypothetical protein
MPWPPLDRIGRLRLAAGPSLMISAVGGSDGPDAAAFPPTLLVFGPFPVSNFALELIPCVQDQLNPKIPRADWSRKRSIS